MCAHGIVLGMFPFRDYSQYALIKKYIHVRTIEVNDRYNDQSAH